MGVLILAEEYDPCADAMVNLLRARNVDVDRLDLAWFPGAIGVDARLRHGSWSGCREVHGRRIDIEAVSAVWYRSPATFRFPAGLGTAERAHAAIEAKMGIGGLLLSLPALWVNRPDIAATATYKPLQMHVAATAGLTVADTLITTRADSVPGLLASTRSPWPSNRPISGQPHVGVERDDLRELVRRARHPDLGHRQAVGPRGGSAHDRLLCRIY